MKHLPMTTLLSKSIALAGLSAIVAFSACAHSPFASIVHTPPGTGVDVALARKPELVRMPLSPAAVGNHGTSAPGGARTPAVEPELPRNDSVDRVADAYSRGNFCMQAGNDKDAIAAFEETVKIDPSFTEAWQDLATLYEKQGDDKKAVEAYRRAKKLAKQ
jgi:tetratricopeptide (TPR) repeat protein